MRISDQNQELLDSVVEEFTGRLRHGERPAIGEYSDRHPALRSEIEELLSSVAMIEELKTQSTTNANSLKLEMKEILQLDRIEDYKILRELGRGGMGIVFEAVHESLGRKVAIKVMPNRTFDDAKYLERFKREAQAAATLHHTNIVSVFGMGHAGEHRYYVMEFVDGESLSSILACINEMNEANTRHGNNTETLPLDNGVAGSGCADATSQNGMLASRTGERTVRTSFDSAKERFRWAAKLGMQIADGLAYAHGLGTMHRDIKPSNLLVDKNETVWLTDFGLVKNISNQSITKTGDIIGTPQYMAPESFEGQYDERSETYCLGLTLYEMVTLRPAYENVSTPELIRRITTTSPVPPRKLDRQIPRDLNRIILKAISREPAYRYETAADLRDDLRAFLDDRPISARRISMAENIYRWSRRNPLAASLALGTGLMICLVAITSTIFLTISNQRYIILEEKKTSLQVEQRVTEYARDKANANIEFTVELFDQMFKGLVLKGDPSSNDITLDGFDQLTGVSTNVNEADAEFLDQMLHFYMKFAEQNKDNIKLRTLTAKSYRRVANIYHLTGELEQANEAYGKSIQIYEELRKNSPANIPLALELTTALTEKGQVLELQGVAKSRALAMKEYEKAAAILRTHSNAKELSLQLQLAKTLVLIGAPHFWQKPELPERFYEKFAQYEKPNAFVLRSNDSNRIRNPIRAFNLQESKKALGEALEIVDTLIDNNPKKVELQLLKATALTRLAGIYLVPPKQTSIRNRNSRQMILRNQKASKRYLQEAESLIKKLRSEKPSDPDYQFVEALIDATPVRLTSAKTIESLEKSKEILATLVKNHDRNLEYKQLLANVSFRLGRIFEDQGKLKRAESNLNFANENFLEIMRETPRSRQIHLRSFSCLLELCDLQIRNGKDHAAIESLETSISEMDKIRVSNQKIPGSFYLMKANRYLALSMIYQDQGKFEKAKASRYKANANRRRAGGKLIANRSTRTPN